MKSIQSVLDVHHDHPAVECKHVYDLIGDILYPKDDIDTGEIHEVIPVHTKRENGKFDPAFLSNHKTSESYDKMYVLIGQIKLVTARAKQRKDNPFGVVIGRYTECPICHDVGIEFIQRDYNGDSNRTYVRHVFNHWDARIHSVNLGYAEGKVTYDELVKLKKEGKMS